jgi:hypothetical protein
MKKEEPKIKFTYSYSPMTKENEMALRRLVENLFGQSKQSTPTKKGTENERRNEF